MFKHLRYLLLFAVLCVPWAMQAQGTAITSFPFSCDFEDATDNAYWSYQNSTAGWYIGTATNHGGTHALYVSEDNGSTSSYSGSGCVSYAYLTFDITNPGQYAVQFDWKCNGESTYDFLRVALAMSSQSLTTSYSDWTATSVPSGFTAIDGGNKLNLQTSWQTHTAVVSIPAAGTYRLLFVWRNDPSVYNQPPAAIDNVIVTELSCPQPTALSVIPSADQLDISWTAGGDETEWKVTVSDTIIDFVTTNSYTATNLESNTIYSVKVYAICGVDDTSMATSGNYRTSCTAISQLPYSNDFENEPHYSATTYAAAFPSCWNRINDATGTYNYYPYLYASSSYAHSGATGMYWYQSSTSGYAQNEYAILPPIDLDVYEISDLTLSFYAKTTSTSYHPAPIIGVMSNPNDVTTFTPVYTFSTTAITTSWQLFAISLSSYTGTGAYIAIKWPNPNTSSYMAIDDIFLTDEWCDIPGNVVVNPATDEVTISWEPNGGSSFTVFLGEDTIVNVTDTFYVFSNLTPNTVFNYGVATECSNGNSAFIAGSVTTLCGMITTLPFTENFDAAATGSSSSASFVNCLTRLNNGTSYFGYPYVGGSTYNHTPGGSKGLYWYNTTTTGTYGDYQIVVMPGVDTNVYPIRNLQLHFWSRPSSTSYAPQFQVGVMTNPNDASSFVQVRTVNVANTTTWQEFIVPLGTYTGEGQFIALRALRPTSSWYAYVDDITIETQPTCPGVTGMEVNATVGSALVSWNVRTGAPGEAESFNIVVKDEQGNTSNYTTSDMNYIITGLAAGGAYTVYVNADCGSDGEGAADSISFVTASLDCIALDPTTADTAIIAGSSSSTSYYIPIGNYYNYSYTQQLILASELNGPTTFTGIDFQYGYSSAVTAKGNVTIYMANVTVSSLSSGFVPYSSSFVPVYSGNMNVTQGWNHFEFTTPFTYDGSNNLLIVVHDNSGDYDGSSYVYNTHSASGKARYIQNDSDPYDITTVSGGTSLSDRANMKLYSGECDQVAECAAPYLGVSEVLSDEVTLIWIPGYDETSWNIDYREAGTTSWNSAATGISTTSYTISGLNPATDYEFRVYFECSDNETYAANVIVSTLCNETALPYIQGFENVTTSTSSTNYGVMPNCWDYVLTGSGSYITGSYLPGVYYSSTYSNTGNYCLRLAGKGYFMLPPMATSLDSVMLTMNCYITSSSYGIEVGVMEANGTFVSIAQPTLTTSQHTPIEVSFANYSGNSRVIALHNYYSTYDYSYVYVDDIVVDYIPDCARITGVSVNNIGQYDATIHWTAGNSGDYEVVYGLSGFAPADSVAIVVNDVDSVDITNLSPNTAYDVYVREICNGGGYGAWSFSYTFRTECGPITVLPFMESFEAYPVGSSTAPVYEIPCWGRLDNAGQNHFGYVNSASSWSAGPHTGDKFIYYYIPTNTGTHADWIITILPPIDTNVYPMNTLQTSFWVRMNSASTSSFIEVGVISDVTDETTFVPVDTIAVAGDVHTLKTAYLSSFTGYGDHIAYKFHRAAEAHYFFIDDVTIEVIPDCPPVSNIDVVTFDDESITLNWTENGNATSWSIEYGEHGFTLGSGTTVSTTSVPYTINNLNTNTAYDFYISPDCSSGVAGVTMGTYRTACGAITVLPYIENFDGMTGSTATSPVPQGFQPNCWDFYNDGTRSNYQYSPYVYNSSTYAHSGNNCIRFYSYNSSGDSNQYLILPIIDSNAYEVSDLQVSFWVRGNSTSSSYRADVVVGIMTDIYDESSFIPYDTVLCASTTYSYHEVMFSQWTGANGRITLLFPKPLTSSSYEYGYLDDVTVEPIPDCPQVSNITLAGLDSNWLSVSWVENGNATSWNIEYGLHGFTLGNGTTTVATSIPFTISGLSPNTDYDVYITPVCTDGTAATRMGTFRTANVYLQLPFACGFEDSVQNLVWVLENGSNTNKWYIGSGTNNGGSNALYVSDNNGTSCNYTISSSTMVFAYADVMINTPGDYNYSFDWKSYGESTIDYIRAALVPVSETLTAGTSVPSGFSSSALPSGWIALDGGQKLNLQSAWQTRSDFVTVPSAGVYHLVFAFRCDGSVGTQPPAAIDNVVFIANTCSAPANLHSTANTATTIDLAWNANSNAAAFLVSYGNSPLSDPMNGTVTSVTTNSFSATGLGNLDYYFYVRTVCTNGDSSLWIPIGPIHPGSWNMRANMTDTLYMCGGVIYDDGGPSGDYAMSQNSYIILYPDAPNNIVSINGTATIEGNSYDKLFIYDGVGTSGTQLVGLQGTSYSGGTTVSATSTSGPLTIYFTSDGSVTYSGFVLNVSCISSTCMVSNLALDATVPESATQLALTWDNNGALLYEIEYGTGAFTPGFGMGNTLSTTQNHAVLTGLTGLTTYHVYIRSICTGADTGSWSHAVFSTVMCDNPTMAYSYDSTMSSTTSSYGPLGYSFYNYGYTQTLVPASRLTDLAGDITAFSFFPTVTTAGDEYESMTVWLANVSDSNLTAGAITPDSAHVFVKVIDNASFSYTTTGEQIHGFDTAFTWDGVSNLLVSVKRDNGSYTSGATFSAHSTPQTMTRYFYQDSGPISHTAPSASSTGSQNLIGDMLFYSCGLGCARPTTLPATDVTYQSATLNWNSNATDFEVAVKAVTDATWPAEVAVSNATSYAVSGLAPATNYQFRVRAVCDATEALISDWVEGTFVTDSLPCFVPDGLQVVSTGYTTATIQWNADASQSQWSIHVWNSANDFVFDAQTNPFTVTGLAQNLEYNVAVKAVCGGGYTESEYSDTITFTTGQCAQVTGVNVTGITSNSAVVNWTSTGAPRYKVEYGDRGFPQGTGTTVFVENGQTSITLENLVADNNYSVFVMAICEEGVEGAWSERYDFATLEEQGIDVVNGNMNLSIYPNPTSDATTIALSGVNGEVQIVIVDMNGRTVMSDSMSCEGDCTKRMEVSGLAQGAYFVRVSGEGVNQVKKLVVK